MCKIMDDYAKEYAKEYHEEEQQKTMLEALKNGLSPEVVAKAYQAPLEMILNLMNKVQ